MSALSDGLPLNPRQRVARASRRERGSCARLAASRPLPAVRRSSAAPLPGAETRSAVAWPDTDVRPRNGGLRRTHLSPASLAPPGCVARSGKRCGRNPACRARPIDISFAIHVTDISKWADPPPLAAATTMPRYPAATASRACSAVATCACWCWR